MYIIFLRYTEKQNILVKTDVGVVWATFGMIWPTFYFTTWSHCSQQTNIRVICNKNGPTKDQLCHFSKAI